MAHSYRSNSEVVHRHDDDSAQNQHARLITILWFQTLIFFEGVADTHIHPHRKTHTRTRTE